jgi:serine/threonine-protein kinase
MENNGDHIICPHCGYDSMVKPSSDLITPGTSLNNGKYIVGRSLSRNGEGVTYIALDKVLGTKVTIREYMPDRFCTRVPSRPTISVNPQNLAGYKALMAEFTELNKILGQNRNEKHIFTMLDLFAENNTTYAVFEHISCKTLMEYIKENAGELSLEKMSMLFRPFLTTLANLHGAGITHRGISPVTLLLSGSGDIILDGFCISPTRALGTELSPELFQNYAAPEQFSVNARQGVQTDIYAVCAVLYRVLAGCAPVDAQSRYEADVIQPIHLINKRIPKSVSDVIMQGLKMDINDRPQNITEFSHNLFRYIDFEMKKASSTSTGRFKTGTATAPTKVILEDDNDTPTRTMKITPTDKRRVVGTSDLPDETIDDNPEDKSALDKYKIPLIVGVLTLAVLMVVSIVLLQIFGSSDKPKKSDGEETSSSSTSDTSDISTSISTSEITTGTLPTTSSNSANSRMPNLVGKYYDTVAGDDTFKDWIKFKRVDEYKDGYSKGVIFEQSIAADDSFTAGAEVTLKVSKGPVIIDIPSYDGLSWTAYEKLLNQNEINSFEFIPEPSSSVPAGNVTRTNRSTINRNTQDKLIVYYATTPETTPATTDGGEPMDGDYEF